MGPRSGYAMILDGRGAVVASVLLGVLASLLVGALLASFTGKSVVRSALRQLFVAVLAATAADQARWTDAERLLRRSLAVRQADRTVGAVAETLHDLGVANQRLGRLDQALGWFEDARISARAAGRNTVETAALRGLAAVSLAAGRPVVGFAYAQEAGRAATTSDDRNSASDLLREVGEQARLEGAAGLATEAYRAAAELLADAG